MTRVAALPVAPPTLETLLRFDPPAVPALPILAGLLLFAYALGVVRLRRLGRRWKVTRSGSFALGCGLVVAISVTGLERYADGLFSAFVFQQLTLMIAVPPFLVLGAPGTLLLRSVPRRGLGRLVLRIAVGGLRGRVGRALLHPGLGLPLFLVSFYGVYLGGILDAAFTTAAGHVVLDVVFLAVGVLFTVPLLSPDPLPVRMGHLGRVVDVFAEMALHAFFGVIVMIASVPIVDAFADPPASWGVDPVGDQQIAGALAWSYGEFPSLVVILVLLRRWSRDEQRRNAATERAGAGDDPELDAYNDLLARLHRAPAADRTTGGER